MRFQSFRNLFFPKIFSKLNKKSIFASCTIVAAGFLSNSIYLDEQIKTIVYSWGYGNFGQLGLSNENIQYSPQEIQELSDRNIVQLDASKSVSMALSKDGKVYSWGRNKGGILGHEDRTSFNMTQPELIQRLELLNMKSISCGPSHMAGITENGELYTWGNKDYGKLGHEMEESSNKVQIKRGNQKYDWLQTSMLPTKVQALNGIKCKQVSCGGSFTVVLTENGEVYTFGNGDKGQLGYNSDKAANCQPKKIPELSNVVSIDSGQQFSAAVTKEGKLYVWGSNDHGQLGNNQSIYLTQPSMVHGLGNGNKIVSVSCGDNFVASLCDSGKVFTWGSGNDGQLGHNNKSDLYAPKMLQFKEKIIKVDCGGSHSAFVTQSNKLYIFGRGNEGQLGVGENIESEASYRSSPKQVEYFKNKKVIDVVCGGEHTLAIVV